MGVNFHTIKKLHVRVISFSFPFFLVSARAANIDGLKTGVEDGGTTADVDVDGTDATVAGVDVDGTTADPYVEGVGAGTGLLFEL